MKFNDIILEKIEKEEIHKLNIMSFLLSEPPVSAKRIVYPRRGAACEFYNAQDIAISKPFYKHISLMP